MKRLRHWLSEENAAYKGEYEQQKQALEPQASQTFTQLAGEALARL